MNSVAANYYRAAFERIKDANLLHDEERFPLAMYASGLAVECLLRAFRVLRDPTFDARHDLVLLWKQTALGDVRRETTYKQIHDLLAEINKRWQNSYRFASNDEVRSSLKKSRQDRGVKGDLVKYNSKKLYEAAKNFLKIGEQQWKLLNKK